MPHLGRIVKCALTENNKQLLELGTEFMYLSRYIDASTNRITYRLLPRLPEQGLASLDYLYMTQGVRLPQSGNL